MPIYKDQDRNAWVFEFNRVLSGQRFRTKKILPKAWSKAQALTFDREETARLYSLSTGVHSHSHTLDEAIAIYLTERVPLLKSGHIIERELAQCYWAFNGRPIEALADVCKAYATKTEGLAPATIKNRISYMRSAARYAWKHHKMCEHDPAQRVTVPQVRNERRVFITRAEMLSIARACKSRATRAYIRIAFYSGMRAAEIIRAKRGDGVFILDDTKNGEPRHVPMHPKIISASKVKMNEQSKMSKHYVAARRAVKLDHVHFHDLRHSAASEMINAGIDLYTVGAVLGHKSSQSTQRYAHLATESLSQAINLIGKKRA